MYPTQAGRRIFHHAPTTCSSSTLESSSSEGSVESVGTGQGYQKKTGAPAILTKAHFNVTYSPYGWLDCDIIQQGHILLHNENLNNEGF